MRAKPKRAIFKGMRYALILLFALTACHTKTVYFTPDPRGFNTVLEWTDAICRQQVAPENLAECYCQNREADAYLTDEYRAAVMRGEKNITVPAYPPGLWPTIEAANQHFIETCRGAS